MQYSVSRDIYPKFAIPNILQSSDIGKILDIGISHIWMSGQYLNKENCYNSRTSHDIDMRLGPVAKLDKRNTATS